MRSSDIAPFVALLAFVSGCVITRDVGDNRMFAIERDAAQATEPEAGMDAGPAPYNPPPRYPVEAASSDAFALFKTNIGGTWYGIVSLPDQAKVMQLQLDLDPVAETYKIYCLQKPGCDPFGLASSRAEGGTYRIDYLDRSGTAYGFFAWVGPFFAQRITFRDMLLQRQNQVLSFGFRASIGQAGERTAVFVRTPPELDMDAQVPTDDGGVP